MRSSWFKVLIVAACATASSSAVAQTGLPQTAPYYLSGGQLYRLCKLRAVKVACEDYIEGAVDYLVLDDQAMSQTGLSHQPSWCANAPLSFDRIYEVVFKYLASHRPDETESAVASVYVALTTAYPCAPGSPSHGRPRR
jgi:hypothetical protein